MPVLRCGKICKYSEKLKSKDSIRSQNAVPLNIPANSPYPKITATGEFLFSIHKKIQRHLTGTKILSKFEVRKLMLILNRMHCPSPVEHEIMATAQNILSQIHRRLIAECTTGQDENGALLNNAQDSTGLTDPSSLEKYEALCSAISNIDSANNANSDNNMSLPSILKLSQDLSQESARILTGECGSDVFNSQSSDVIKLRLNGVEESDQDYGSISFPLELLTNNEFVISQKNVNSGSTNQNTFTENNSILNTENVELHDQLKDAPAVDNNSFYNKNMSYDERIMTNNTQKNLQTNEYSCKTTPEISGTKIPEPSSQMNASCFSGKAKVSKNTNKAFEINSIDILNISSFTTNTPPASFEAYEKMMSSSNAAISSNKEESDGYNFSVPFSKNISLSAEKNLQNSSGIEDPSQLTVADYKNETTRIPGGREHLALEGDISEKNYVDNSQAAQYNFSDANSPEIMFIDCQNTNIDDDVEITDPDNESFPNAQNQAMKSAEYSRLFTNSTWEDSHNKISQPVFYDADPLISPAPASQESDMISSLDKIGEEFKNKLDLPRESDRQTSANINDVLPEPSKNTLDTDEIISETTSAADCVSNAAKKLHDQGIKRKTLDQSDNESLVFNLEPFDSAIDVIEATSSSKHKPVSRLEHQTRQSVTITDNSETEDIIIDETAYSRSESAIFKTRSVKKYGISSSYKSQTQSSSFLNYKSRGKSPRCILSRRTNSGMAFNIDRSPIAEAQSNNILMIDGDIPRREDRMESTPIAPEEESFAEKQTKLQEKVMRKRNTYRAKWKDIPLTEKISSKFIQKFHVRIFEDPVSSLTNIDYKPNFNNFHFSRQSIHEINAEMKSSWRISRMIDDALTKAVSGLQEKSTKEWATAFLRSSNSDSDSDSSDEEKRANNKWLIEYIQKAQYENDAFSVETSNEMRNIESERRSNWENRAPGDDEDRDEQLENLLKKLGEFDWFIE